MEKYQLVMYICIWIIVMDIFGKFLDKLEMDYKILFKLI